MKIFATPGIVVVGCLIVSIAGPVSAGLAPAVPALSRAAPSGAAPSGVPGLPGPFANVRVNQDASGMPQNETSIAVDPLDFDHLVGGWNDYRFSGTEDVKAGYGYSFDGGLTWGDGVLPGYTAYDAQGDPALAFDRSGRVFFALIAFDRDMVDNGVYVSISSDGGVNWASPVPINVSGREAFNDKPYIAADITDGPYRGNVYVTWTIFGSTTPIYLSRSTDGGGSFSPPLRVSDSNYTQGSIPVVGPDGAVHVAWLDYEIGNRIMMNTSRDGGASFEPNLRVTTASSDPGTDFFGAFLGDYSGLASTFDTSFPLWCDTRNGEQDAYTAIVPTAPDNAEIDVVLAPDLTQVPRGGALTGNYTLTNLTGGPRAFDPLAEIRLPNGSMMVHLDPGVATLPGNGTLDRAFSIPVPGNAPIGAYLLKVTLYDPATGGAISMDYFPFDIVP